MRILAFFAKFTFIVFLAAGTGFLIAREVLLRMAANTVESSVSELLLISQRGSSSASCLTKGITINPSTGGPVLQLRFISDTEYVLEVNCVENSLDPVLLKQNVLPPFVTKTQGGSGFTLQPKQSAVELTVFAELEDFVAQWLFVEPTFISRSTTIAATNGRVVEDYSPLDYDNGPVTSCTGYGYFCCDIVSQKGVGASITGLTGCEKSCYSQCVSRPLVLSFTTSPFYDFKTRSLTVRQGETVEFAYVSDPGKGNTVTAMISFGDGDTQEVTADSGSALHKYACAEARCEYTAKLKLVDNWGVESAETGISAVTIIVQ